MKKFSQKNDFQPFKYAQLNKIRGLSGIWVINVKELYNPQLLLETISGFT